MAIRRERTRGDTAVEVPLLHNVNLCDNGAGVSTGEPICVDHMFAPEEDGRRHGVRL